MATKKKNKTIGSFGNLGSAFTPQTKVPPDMKKMIAESNANRPEGYGELTAQVSNIGMPRVYEDNVMLGSTTWVYRNRERSAAKVQEIVAESGHEVPEGWTIIGAEYPGLVPMTFFAVRDDMTEAELAYHLDDKSAHPDLNWIAGAVEQYWDVDLKGDRNRGASELSRGDRIMAAFGDRIMAASDGRGN